MLRYVILFIFICLYFFPCSLVAKKLEVNVVSDKVILIHADSGKILFEKNIHEKAFPASITKIATALYALELKKSNLDEIFEVSKNAVGSITPSAKKQSNFRSPAYLLETDATHMSLKAGEQLPFYELLSGMLIASANDAANVVAEKLAKSIPEFVEQMNLYIKQIGCNNTHFCNPHGLHHPDHQTTAYDMAMIAKEAWKHPLFREIVAKKKHICPKTNLEYERTLVQTNMLLRSGSFHYSKAVGIKTGYTGRAGTTLVSAASSEDRTLIAVVMGSPSTKDRYEDSIRLFEAAFSEKKMRRWLIDKSSKPFKKKISHAKQLLVAYLPEGLYYDFYPSEESPIKCLISWSIPSLPIQQGAPVGTIKIVDDQGIVLKSTFFYAANDVKEKFWFYLKNRLKQKKIIYLATSVGVFLFIIARSTFKKHKRT